MNIGQMVLGDMENSVHSGRTIPLIHLQKHVNLSVSE